MLHFLGYTGLYMMAVLGLIAVAAVVVLPFWLLRRARTGASKSKFNSLEGIRLP